MRISKTKKGLDYSILIVALAIFSLSRPYFTWSIPLNAIFYFFINIFIAYKFYKHSHINHNFVLLYIGTCLLYLFLTLIHGLATVNGIILNILPIFLYVGIPFVEREYGRKIFEYYTWIFAIILAFSLFFWILALNDMVPSLGTIRHYNQNLDRTYTVYPFVVVEFFLGIGTRFSGPFDEPGVVGSFCAFFLCMLRFNIKDIRCLFFFIAGVCSLSFFFYGVIVVYWLIHLLFSKRNAIGTILVLLIFWGFYNFTSKDTYISDRLWSRFEWNSSRGTFNGDNRLSEDAAKYYEKLKGTTSYLFGVDDAKEYWNIAFGGSSYKNIIVMYGAIFFYLYIFFFISLGYKYKSNWSDFVLFMFLLLINTYQRTNLYFLDWIFLYAYLARLKDFNLLEKNNK